MELRHDKLARTISPKHHRRDARNSVSLQDVKVAHISGATRKEVELRSIDGAGKFGWISIVIQPPSLFNGREIHDFFPFFVLDLVGSVVH